MSSYSQTIALAAICIYSCFTFCTVLSAPTQITFNSPTPFSAVSQSWKSNGEEQVYVPSQAQVVNGNLVLTAQRSGNQFISGKVVSTQYFTFGKFTVTAQMPMETGLWGAFWFLPAPVLQGTRAWPEGGELDLIECNNEKHSIFSSAHWYVPSEKDNQRLGAVDALSGDAARGWHTWTMIWTPDSITFSVDGHPPHYSLSGRDVIPQESLGIVINLAVGGNMGGPTSNLQGPYSVEIASITYSPL